MVADGNIALKVIWIQGQFGPFTSPCSAQGREINVVQNAKVWCTQSGCNCNWIYYKKHNDGDYWNYFDKNNLDEWPCYDSAVFVRWQFGSGIYHHGKSRNKPIPIKYCKPGKLVFLTSRESGKPESDRKIIGCFSIAGITTHPDWGNVIHAGAIRLRASDFDHAPLYWAHHKQNGGPRWGTGLFRYIPDSEAQTMLNALVVVC